MFSLMSTTGLVPTVAAIGLNLLLAVSIPIPPSGTIMKVAWVANVACLILNTYVVAYTLGNA